MSVTLKRSIYIGLGGAGIKSILETKKQFIEQYGEIPSMIQFLGIDTNEGEFKQAQNEGEVILTAGECCDISGGNLSSFYDNAKEHLNWLPSNNIATIPTPSLNRSPSQIRTNGRLAFIANIEKVYFYINQAYLKAANYTSVSDSPFVPEDNVVRFHIIFSLAGGTGSACFIDLAYMIRERFYTNSRNLIGYAILPDVYKEMIPNGPEMSRICSNAYAALHELEYLMHLKSDSEPYTLDWMSSGFYDEKAFARNPRPFSWVYLIGNKNGKVVIESLSLLTKLLGRTLFIFCGAIGSNIESIQDNISNYAIENGRWASSLGLSSVVYEGNAAADVFAVKMSLELVENLLLQDNSKEGADMAANMLKETGIYDGGYYVNFLDAIGPAKPAFSVDFVDKKRAGFEVTPACSKLLRELDYKAETYCAEEGNLENKLKLEVLNCLMKGKGGLSQAENLLKEVIALSSNIISQMREEMVFYEGRRGSLKDSMEKEAKALEEEMNKSLFTRKGTLVDELQGTMRACAEAYLSNEMEIKRRQVALQVLDKLREQAGGESTDTLLSLREKLQKTRDSLKSKLHESAGIGTETELARFFRCLDLSESESALHDFLASLGKNGLEEFASAEELETALNSFTQKQWLFKHYLSATLPEAVRDLSKDAVAELFYQALDKSRSLIQYDPQLNKPFGLGSAYRILGVENEDNSPFADATAELLRDNHVETVSTGLKYMILFFTMETPFPIEIIEGVDRWKMEYEIMEKNISSHIDVCLKERINNKESDQ